MYMRMSISAQSQASVPPAPAWIVRKALQWSLGPLSIDWSSNALKSLSAFSTSGLDVGIELVGLGFLGQLDRGRQVFGLRDQLFERLEHPVERLQLGDDRFGLVLVVPERRTFHITWSSLRRESFSPKSKRVS